jgi:hypothetical protein
MFLSVPSNPRSQILRSFVSQYGLLRSDDPVGGTVGGHPGRAPSRNLGHFSSRNAFELLRLFTVSALILATLVMFVTNVLRFRSHFF